MEIKICTRCKEEKDICEFNKSSRNKSGLRSECKKCQVIYYNNNIEKLKKRRKERYLEYSELELNRNKKYYINNRLTIIENLKVKRKTDHHFRLKNNVRSRIIQYLKSCGLHKDNKTFDIVGCSPEFLREYIENKFTDGMSWELMGKYIHLDHIIPLSSANSKEEVYKLCHYTNLQPLWSEDNLRKGKNIIP